MAADMEVVDIDCANSPPGSPSKRKRSNPHKEMMSWAIKYPQIMARVKKRSEQQSLLEDPAHYLSEDSSEEDSFSTYDPGLAVGIEAFDNPYMEIFNVAMATAGMLDMKRQTNDEYLRKSKLPEPLMYVDTDGSGDEEEGEMVIKEEDGQEDVMEVKEVSVSLIKKIPVRTYPSKVVSTITHEFQSSQDTTNLPPSSEQLIDKIVDNRVLKWSKEGKLDHVTKAQYKELTHQLKHETKLFLTSQIEGHISTT